MTADPEGLLQEICRSLATHESVKAVVIAGSQGSGRADALSDHDLYVYSDGEPPLEWRRALAERFSHRFEVGNRFWEPGDEWVLRDGAGVVDVMYRAPEWISGELSRVLERFEASTGYSTCFWHNVLASRALHDPQGWYEALQRSANRPYPEGLKRAIVAKNHPILCRTISSYFHQVEVALRRGDRVAVNHRVAAFLASCFDIVFAVNEIPHPGEKRLSTIVTSTCRKLPDAFEESLAGVLASVSHAARGEALLEGLRSLGAGIDALLDSEGLIRA